MDSAAEAFRKNEARLKNLSLKPSEYVHRQIRVTPYPHELEQRPRMARSVRLGWKRRHEGALQLRPQVLQFVR